MDININRQYIATRTLNLVPRRILLAESNPATVDGLISHAIDSPSILMAVCDNGNALKTRIAQDPPDLLLLGTMEKFYWFDLCYSCREIDENLPILLIVDEKAHDEYFRRWANVRGATDIVRNSSEELTQLFAQWTPSSIESDSVEPTPKDRVITMETIMNAIAEINQFSQSYFGSLAQGNYWRKTYDRLISEHPALKYWSADIYGKISCHSAALDAEVTDEDLHSLRLWISLFVAECERSLFDFGQLLTQSYFSPQVRKLIIS
jgi:hypothetical protein